MFFYDKLKLGRFRKYCPHKAILFKSFLLKSFPVMKRRQATSDIFGPTDHVGCTSQMRITVKCNNDKTIKNLKRSTAPKFVNSVVDGSLPSPDTFSASLPPRPRSLRPRRYLPRVTRRLFTGKFPSARQASSSPY